MFARLQSSYKKNAYERKEQSCTIVYKLQFVSLLHFIIFKKCLILKSGILLCKPCVCMLRSQACSDFSVKRQHCRCNVYRPLQPDNIPACFTWFRNWLLSLYVNLRFGQCKRQLLAFKIVDHTFFRQRGGRYKLQYCSPLLTFGLTDHGVMNNRTLRRRGKYEIWCFHNNKNCFPEAHQITRSYKPEDHNPIRESRIERCYVQMRGSGFVL
jgi:hypothetical protein